MGRFCEYTRKVSHNDTRTAWVLKCDIRKFFASIDHEILRDILNKHIRDTHVVWLLDEVIRSFHTTHKTGVGLPLGNLTSQLLANVYMNEFDHFLKRDLKVIHCVRYADDFVIVHEDKQYLKNLLPHIATFLETRLKLSLHPNKVFIKTIASGVDFLGWVHFPRHRTLRTSTKRRMFKRLRSNTSESSYVAYRGLLKHGNTHKLIQKHLNT